MSLFSHSIELSLQFGEEILNGNIVIRNGNSLETNIMRHRFNSFNINLLVPRPPNLHKNINKQRKTHFLYCG